MSLKKALYVAMAVFLLSIAMGCLYDTVQDENLAAGLPSKQEVVGVLGNTAKITSIVGSDVDTTTVAWHIEFRRGYSGSGDIKTTQGLQKLQETINAFRDWDGTEILSEQGCRDIRANLFTGEVIARLGDSTVTGQMNNTGIFTLKSSESFHGKDFTLADKLNRDFPWQSSLSKNLDCGARVMQEYDINPHLIPLGGVEGMIYWVIYEGNITDMSTDKVASLNKCLAAENVVLRF